jgi:16S RNA G1207 methylase RsmC
LNNLQFDGSIDINYIIYFYIIKTILINFTISQKGDYMSHYFIPDDNLKSDQRQISYSFKGKNFIFTTDSGVFSKDQVDYATGLLLANLPKLTGSLLDMGCGYGCIGIILAKVWELNVTQCDVNPNALKLTELNCKSNGVETKLTLSDCFDNITEKFDTITINPPIHAGKAVTYKMYDESITHLNDNGRLFIVTLKKHGAESTQKKLIEVYGNCEAIYKKKGYYVFCCTKKSLA